MFEEFRSHRYSDSKQSPLSTAAEHVPLSFSSCHPGPMSWTEDQINKLRDRMSFAKRAGEWLSASEIHIVLDLIAFWRRATLRKGWNGPIEGLPPTIAETRVQGITHFSVTCSNPACYGHTRRLALDDLRMPGGQPVPETAAFVDIPNRCRFRCLQCGGRKVSVMAHWPSMDNVAVRERLAEKR